MKYDPSKYQSFETELKEAFVAHSVDDVDTFYLHMEGVCNAVLTNSPPSWRVKRAFKMIMEVIYCLDIDRIPSWKSFTDAIHARWKAYGPAIMKIVTKRNHRHPPKSKYYHAVPRGTCRFCGQPILKPDGKSDKRKHWHPSCVTEHKQLTDPSLTRKAVFQRDHGVCCDCGVIDDRLSGEWEADHIVPLIESGGDINAWKLTNLATRCKECHREKSITETRRRAERRKNG